MAKRRSLDDALTPEEQAFLEQGNAPSPPKSKANPRPKKKPTSKKKDIIMARPAVKQDFSSQIDAPITPPAVPIAGVASLNARISPEISIALLTASTQRKIQRLHPWTQQDIVAEALRDWLRKHGCLA